MRKAIFITIDDIRNAPMGTVYVFGDNLLGVGLGGQAKIARPFVKIGKAFGIPTKRAPGTMEKDYFSDKEDEIRAVQDAFAKIDRMIAGGSTIVFFPGIGEGLAELPSRSPIIHDMIRDFVASRGG
jgi:putative intracellular protease/amidase